ncbi:hypothetical protein M9458_039388, partial [Cirrhinus mrigala]
SIQRSCTSKVWQSRSILPFSCTYSTCPSTSVTCVCASFLCLTSSSIASWSCCLCPSPWRRCSITSGGFTSST